MPWRKYIIPVNELLDERLQEPRGPLGPVPPKAGVDVEPCRHERLRPDVPAFPPYACGRMGPSGIVAFSLAGAALAPAAWLLAQRERAAPLGAPTKAVTTAALGIVAGVAAWRVDPFLAALGTACALGASVPIAVVDSADYRIPDRLVFGALAVSGALFAVQALTGEGPAVRALLGAALYYGTLGLIHLVTPAKMGYGDVKLAGLLGLPLGWQGWLAVPLSLVLASMAGLLIHGVLVAAGRRSWRDILPFGVYLAIGATVTVAIGGAGLGSLVEPT